MFWLARLLRRRKLTGIRRPTRVLVSGTIVSPNTVVSPVTSQPAAVIQWELYRRMQVDKRLRYIQEATADGDSEYGYTDCRPFARGQQADELSLGTDEGPVLHVPAAPLTCGVARKAVEYPLPQPPPMALEEGLQSPEARATAGTGEIWYRERCMLHGDVVLLRATVEPMGHAGGPYRQRSAEPFVVRADLEPPHLYQSRNTPARR